MANRKRKIRRPPHALTRAEFTRRAKLVSIGFGRHSLWWGLLYVLGAFSIDFLVAKGHSTTLGLVSVQIAFALSVIGVHAYVETTWLLSATKSSGLVCPHCSAPLVLPWGHNGELDVGLDDNSRDCSKCKKRVLFG